MTLTFLETNWPGLPPQVDTFLVTEGGSGYHVIAVRGRRVTCIKIEPDNIPDDALVQSMGWVSRNRRKP